MPYGRPRWRYLIGFVLLTTSLAWARSPASRHIQHTAGEEDALQLAVAGQDQWAWLIVGRPDSEKEVFVYRFARLEMTASRLEPMALIHPQRGTMQRWAAVGSALHVFYAADAVFTEPGAHYRYDRAGGGARARLPGPVMPLAVAGATSEGRSALWAVVSARTAEKVRENWQQARRSPLLGGAPTTATGPYDTDPATMPSTVPATLPVQEDPSQETADPSVLHLVWFDGLLWRPGPTGPPDSAVAERVWLAGGPADQLHLLWQDEESSTRWHYARWDGSDAGWAIRAPLQLAPEAEPIFAGLINRSLIVATRVPAKGGTEGGSKGWHCRSWSWAADGREGSWHELPPLRVSAEDDAEELTLPPGTAVGNFADNLVVLRPEDNDAETATYEPLVGGGPERDFEGVRVSEWGPRTRSVRGWRDLAATLAVAALVVLVFWRRQDAVVGPPPLPEGVEIARPGKRIVAAGIDMLPAAAVVAIVWHATLVEFATAFWPAFTSGRAELIEQVPWPTTLVWAWVWFRILYAGYATVCELIWQATLGKRLMGCHVRMETHAPAGTVPIIVRNVTKLVELEPYLLIWPFILVIFFTRHHQRLGDLLARTIVVERQADALTDDAKPRPEEPD